MARTNGSNTFEILYNCLDGLNEAQLNSINGTYEALKAVYNQSESALNVNITNIASLSGSTLATGLDTQVTFMDGSNLGGDAGFTYDKITGTMGVPTINNNGAKIVFDNPITLNVGDLNLSSPSLVSTKVVDGSNTATSEVHTGGITNSFDDGGNWTSQAISNLQILNEIYDAGTTYSIHQQTNALVDITVTSDTDWQNLKVKPDAIEMDGYKTDAGDLALYLKSLPTTDPVEPDRVWSDNGTLKMTGAAPGGVGYKVYTALLTQEGIYAPIATVLENTIGDIVWTYDSPGNYTVTLDGAFPVSTTFISFGASNFSADFASPGYLGQVSLFFVAGSNEDDNTLYFQAGLQGLKFDSPNYLYSNTLMDDVLYNIPIEIRVYPSLS